MKTLRGRKALVTGAARGIGRSIAIELAKAGCDVWLVDLDAEALQTAAAEVHARGVEAVSEICDVAEPQQISRCVAAVLRRWGKLHVLVNNAGVVYYGPVRELTAEHWRHTLAVDLHAAIQFIRELLPTLEAQDEAHILNVSSVGGLVAIRNLAAYQTCKFALVGLTQSLRADLRWTGVGATALCPGFTKTRFIQRVERLGSSRQAGAVPDRWCTTPEHVAKAAVKAIRRNRGLVVLTPLAKMLFGLWRLSPRLFDFLRKHL
jgi:short-subunit dehydrogenase